MRRSEFAFAWQELATEVSTARAVVDDRGWTGYAAAVRQAGGRLISLWGSDRRAADGQFTVCAAYALGDGLSWLTLPLDARTPQYPDLSAIFPAAVRMQRAAFDLVGVSAQGADDTRGWLRHGVWPADYFPLRTDASGHEVFAQRGSEDYPFVTVEGDGVHEIAVGPVHAGIIEPGHFRFSVVGEKVLRLEQRLGYKHKGIDKLFERTPPAEGHRLAGRVSGDSTVAFAWAYCMALESYAGVQVPARAKWLRALMLERERVANHLGDLGALGNDAAFAFGLAQFSRLKEEWLRLSRELFGHRFMMDCIVPGGVAGDVDAGACDRLRRQCDHFETATHELQAIYDEHAGLQDRFMTTGCVSPELAQQLGLCGLAGRASGSASDLRCDIAWPPYADLDVKKIVDHDGDVAARVRLRFGEVFESLRLIRAICDRLPSSPIRVEVGLPDAAGAGAGWVEGWRGDVLVAADFDRGGRIGRCHCHDPSWQNWPVLEHAVIGNIVPDFPLINKSFNLSYAGHDL